MSFTYCIRHGYKARLDNEPAREHAQKDSCQNEVYKAARRYFDMLDFESVLDVGTGGGFKLLKYFSNVKTLGLDIEPNLSFLLKTYPDRQWREVPLTDRVDGFDLLICSDVIEHLVNPNDLMDFIVRSHPKLVVISTPDRDYLQPEYAKGPPKNECHVREWKGDEFSWYMAQYLDIIEHIAPEPGGSTQTIIGTVK